MLCALVRPVSICWTQMLANLFRLWGWLRYSAPVSRIITLWTKPSPQAPETNITRNSRRHLDSQGFPTTTECQSNQARRKFIESLDLDAICALAARHNNGQLCKVVNQDHGSFNVCFFVEFATDGSQWVVRVPIEPAIDDPWEKLVSEVVTIQYLESNTRIPVPHIRAYGRDGKLTQDNFKKQMYLIADFIPGVALNTALLVEAEETHRRNFYSQLIDILAELRQLEFPTIGSLMPGPYGGLHPVVGPIISMSATTLRLPTPTKFSSAREYMRYQFNLISTFFDIPVADHTIEDIQKEVFSLYGMQRIFDEVIDSQLTTRGFVLSHLDLRSRNIIVDDKLHVRGIIDWEFAGAVPLFTPPSWITGHDSMETNKQTHAEFRDVLNEKSKHNEICDQLRREWYGPLGHEKRVTKQTDIAFCVAHVLRRPTDVTDTFCDFFVPRDSGKSLDDIIAEFFDTHHTLASEVQRRAQLCERYTQHLRDLGEYETEEDKLLEESKALKEKWGWS